MTMSSVTVSPPPRPQNFCNCFKMERDWYTNQRDSFILSFTKQRVPGGRKPPPCTQPTIIDQAEDWGIRNKDWGLRLRTAGGGLRTEDHLALMIGKELKHNDHLVSMIIKELKLITVHDSQSTQSYQGLCLSLGFKRGKRGMNVRNQYIYI